MRPRAYADRLTFCLRLRPIACAGETRAGCAHVGECLTPVRILPMGDLSPHFSRSEFDCHDGTPSSPDPALIACLERLRHLCGDHPLRIASGYRTPAYNAAVGGAAHSQHLVNRAADIPAGYAKTAQAQAAGFTGIGSCGQWAVHLDVRPGELELFHDC